MHLLIFSIVLIFYSLTGKGQDFEIKDSGIFVPQNKKVFLLKSHSDKKIILLKTNLQVNTDGTPTSYHPYDLRGNSIALNSILNGVAIYRLKDGVRISNPKKPNRFTRTEKNEMATEAYQVFEKFRDSSFNADPAGYRISWKSVLIPDDQSNNSKPCIFKEGKYKGYFASATALKNDFITDKGECEWKNQVDPLEIPSLVLAGGNNILKRFGGAKGDLVVAYNLSNKNMVYAVIGDTGPENNLGEGSVILNMKLLGSNELPKTRNDTYSLATKNNILIFILPGSKIYKSAKPYTQANIEDRIKTWFQEQGYATSEDIKDLFEKRKDVFSKIF